MSTTINVKCIDQVLTVTNTPVIASGGRNESTIEFTFCPKWNDYSVKTAIFYKNKNNVYYAVLDSNNTCVIPHEVLAEDGNIYFGVFGIYGTSTRTSEVLSYKIVQGAITENIQPPSPTPSIYEQILENYQEMLEETERLEEAKVNISDIVNNLTSTDTDKPLSANQGKVLKDIIDGLPTPMQFKGSVGTNGTIEWSNLPSASASNEGWQYKVITDHATTPICEEGDLIISNGSEWVVIPSGDEPSGTVTSITSGNGLTGGTITTSGTLAVDFDVVASKTYVQTEIGIVINDDY